MHGVEYVKYTGGSVTAPCLDMFFYHVQVDDMHHRVVGALVVVDFQLHHPVGAVYLPYFHLAWELKAVDTLSLSSSGQKGRICSYRYHFLSALSPCGRMTVGNSSKSGSHGAFSKSISTSALSHCSRTNTLPGDEEVVLK